MESRWRKMGAFQIWNLCNSKDGGGGGECINPWIFSTVLMSTVYATCFSVYKYL